MSDPRDRPGEGRFRGGGGSSSAAISLPTIVRLAFRWKYTLILPVVLCSIGAVIYALQLQPVYLATAELWARVSGQYTGGPAFSAANTAGQMIIRELLFRRSLLEQLNDEFDIYPTQDGRISDRDLMLLENQISVNGLGLRTFAVSFRSGDPEEAAAVANRIAELLIQAAEEETQGEMQGRVELLQEEVASVEEELLAKGAEIERYQRSSNARLPSNVEDYLGDLDDMNRRLQGINSDILAQQVNRAEVEAQLRSIEETLSVDASRRDDERDRIRPMSERLSILHQQLATALEQYTEDHPRVIQLRREIAAEEQNVEAGRPSPSSSGSGNTSLQGQYRQLSSQIAGIDERLNLLQQQKRDLVERIQDSRTTSASLPQQGALTQLMRDHDNIRARYNSLMTRLDDARLTAQMPGVIGGVSFEIVEPALPPTHRIAPLRRNIAITGFAMGVGLGILLMLVRMQMDSSIRDLDDFRAFTNLPVLGVIPSIRRGPLRRRVKEQAVCLSNPHAVAAEQFRILASRLRSLLDDEGSKVVLVTSATGSEGKTSASINLAVALADIQDEPVCIVDADLRRPNVGRYVANSVADGSAVAHSKGFRDLLERRGEDVLRFVTRVDDFYVLGGGNGDGEPGEGLIASGAQVVLERLRKEFRYVIVDSPPVLPMVDSHLLASYVDRVIMVVRAEHTPREVVQRAAESLDVSKLVGVILNDVDYRHASYRHAYDYYTKKYQPRKRKEPVGRRVRVSVRTSKDLPDGTRPS